MGVETQSVPRAGLVYRVCAWVAFAIFRLQRWTYDVEGLEHVPREGGAVIAANHFSFWDYFLVGMGPYHGFGRPVRILAKESLFHVPIFGWLMRRTGHIRVRRGTSGADALAAAVEALGHGELILIMPEGTVSPAYELLPFRSGAARMAAAAGVPLIPAASWGSHRFHSAGMKRPRWSWRLPTMVRFVTPMHPSPGDRPADVTAKLHDEVAHLLDTMILDYPDGTPAGAPWVPVRFGGGAATIEEADAHVARLRERWRGTPPDQARPDDADPT